MERTKPVTKPRRAYQVSLDIDATPDDVWKALTQAEELVRWFPLEARVTPGNGGSMRWSWGEAWVWETRIDAWEPGRLLRLVQEDARPYDAEGRPLPPGQVQTARIAMEFWLETHRGKTRLRLVHSGFGHGAAWDDEIDGISRGWPVVLRDLRHYLQCYRGRVRHAASVHVATTAPLSVAWAKLVSPDAFPITGLLEVGSPYTVHVATGDRFSGRVEYTVPGRTFYGTVQELGGGTLELSTYRGGGQTGVHVRLGVYGEGVSVSAFEARTSELLNRLFRGGGGQG